MTETAIVKLTKEDLALVGASSPSEFPDKLRAFAAAAKQLETAMAEQPDLKTFESRIVALETAVKGIPNESSIGITVGAAVATAVPKAMTEWAGSEAGKKLIGAEASRITMEAFAATGTQPAKPAPAPAQVSTDEQLMNLEKAGKFEEAFALLPMAEQSKYLGAKSYAAFMKASNRGGIFIGSTKNQNQN